MVVYASALSFLVALPFHVYSALRVALLLRISKAKNQNHHCGCDSATNGTYYVVEAVADNSYQKLWVQSAYLQKNNEDVTQAPAEGDNTNHETNAQSAPPSPSSAPIIPNDGEKVNKKSDYTTRTGKVDMSDIMMRANKRIGNVYTAFVDEGKYGGKELLALNEMLIPAKNKTVSTPNSSDVPGDENVADRFAVAEMLSDEALENVVAYQKANGNNVPLHVLGTSKGSTLYKALNSAGMINTDGTVNATALVNAYQQRNSDQNSGLQGTGKDGIINNKTSAVRSDDNGGTNAELLEGREVSTADRSQDRVRTYGANTEIIRGELGNLQRSKGNNDIPLAAGETAWLSNSDFGPARKMGGGLEESFLRNIQGVRSNGFDSVGRTLSPELQEKVSDTVFIQVMISPYLSDAGKFEPDKNLITLNERLFADETEQKKTLIHELQHAVQRIEGFARGSSSVNWDVRIRLGEQVTDAKGKPVTADEAYWQTAGEIEARDVMERLDKTDLDRKNTRPDIDRDDVVFWEKEYPMKEKELVKHSIPSDHHYVYQKGNVEVSEDQNSVDNATKAGYNDDRGETDGNNRRQPNLGKSGKSSYGEHMERQKGSSQIQRFGGTSQTAETGAGRSWSLEKRQIGG